MTESEARADHRRNGLNYLLQHDELLLAWLQDLAHFLNIIGHAFDSEVDLCELKMDLNRALDRTISIRDEEAMVMRQCQRLDLAPGVWQQTLLALSDGLLQQLVPTLLAQDNLAADAQLDARERLGEQDQIRCAWVEVQVHQLVAVLVSVVGRPDELAS